uniref:Protein arginine methyltransferase NDUFAF7 n=1 Tax=Arcella intermedia TaxID=1963864 RepID=A0A6B2L4G5_9EUKA
MKEVLLNPRYGYYMNRDVLGAKGDFITSPEISQIFGELIGIWCISMWEQFKKNAGKIRIIELGPGRGTLMSDMLRSWEPFKDFKKNISIHLVEMSPAFRQIQCKLLTNTQYPEIPIVTPEPIQVEKKETKSSLWNEDILGKAMPIGPMKKANINERKTTLEHKRSAPVDPIKEKIANPMDDYTATTPDGIDVTWHQNISSVPKDTSIIIAHEFFDALPVHQFQYTKDGWRERLIDVNPEEIGSHFRFVLATTPTIASTSFFKDFDATNIEIGTIIEVSPESMVVAQDIGTRIGKHGGASLLIDYGHDRSSEFSLQAIRAHKFVDLFENVGSADLSCMVDFSALKKAALSSPMRNPEKPTNDVEFFGPITQGEFLKNMSIEVRTAILLQNCKDEDQANTLISSYERLIDPDQMGRIYKVLSILNAPQNKHQPPPGFVH